MGPVKSQLDPFSFVVNSAAYCSEQIDEGTGATTRKSGEV